MTIEILKSAKGNEQKQNKPAKPPNPPNPGRSTCQEKTKQGKRKQRQDWVTYLAKIENSPQLL